MSCTALYNICYIIDHIICFIVIEEEWKCIQWLLNDYEDVDNGLLEIIFGHGFWKANDFGLHCNVSVIRKILVLGM